MRVRIPLRPWSLNEHWNKAAGMMRHRLVDQWKQVASVHWRNARRLQDPIGAPPWLLVARSTYTGRRFDVLNDADAIKAIVDALKETGAIPNDSPRFIAAAVLLPPRLGHHDHVDVALVPLPSGLLDTLEEHLG